jgi:putative hydrolase of the HAD superfamily
MTPKIIAFDADDTLFINETYFDETEKKFCGLMDFARIIQSRN